MQIDPSVNRLGATLRDVTMPITEEPLPPDFVMLLVLLDQAEPEEAMHVHHLPHWTSDREPKKP
jgi:hypothetical protein